MEQGVNNDPMGAALVDEFNGSREADIVVMHQHGTDDLLPVNHLLREWKEMPLLEQEALYRCSGKVLDVGAGAGSHTLVLQNRGMDVTAIDISPGAIKVMEQRGIQQAFCADFYRFKKEKYDTLLMLMNGIGLAGKLSGLKDLLLHAKTLLNPNGQILFDSSDVRYLYEEEDGSTWFDLSQEYYGEITYTITYKNHQNGPFPWLYVDFRTLTQHAEATGFSAELVQEDDHFGYLGRLTLND